MSGIWKNIPLGTLLFTNSFNSAKSVLRFDGSLLRNISEMDDPSNVESEYRVIKSEYRVIKGEYRVIKSEYRVIKAEYRVIKSEYRVIKSEYRVMKSLLSV